MRIQKAVITAAAPDQHTLPLQTLVDRDGQVKSVLQLIIEEVTQSGIEQICVVIRPGDQDAYRDAAERTAADLTLLEQPRPQGYGDALLQAKAFVGDDPWLHLVGDHLYLSNTNVCCVKQLIDVAVAESCAISAVQHTRENRLPYFGTVGGKRVPQRDSLYEVTRVIEKPTPTQAEQELIVAGLRSGYYLCYFGMHVLPAAVMTVLEELLDAAPDRKAVVLSSALSVLAERERYLALEVEGSRYNIGMKYGLLNAQLALALSGKDREQILTELVELLALARPAAADLLP